MDLKLKDKITGLLIESPGIPISELAKRTGNYYSYTHKVVSEMEKDGLVEIEKVMKGNKEITICKLTGEYKKEWVSSLKKMVYSLFKDVEVKAAFAIMYLFMIFTFIGKEGGEQPVMLGARAPEGAALAAPAATSLGMDVVIVILIPLLLLVWYWRKRRKR